MQFMSITSIVSSVALLTIASLMGCDRAVSDIAPERDSKPQSENRSVVQYLAIDGSDMAEMNERRLILDRAGISYRYYQMEAPKISPGMIWVLEFDGALSSRAELAFRKAWGAPPGGCALSVGPGAEDLEAMRRYLDRAEVEFSERTYRGTIWFEFSKAGARRLATLSGDMTGFEECLSAQ